MIYLGIDVSKRTFDCCLQINDSALFRQFENNPLGHQALLDWLIQYSEFDVVVCMEATGSYWQGLAQVLYPHCYKLCVENPARIYNYGRARLNRTKTDKQDARLIASYAQSMPLQQWHPPTLVIANLRQHHQMLIRLKRMRASERTKLHETPPELVDIVHRIIASLDEQIDEIISRIQRLFVGQTDLKQQLAYIQSVPGIGPQTAWLLLSIFAGNRFDRPGQVVAYLGLNPAIRQSGTSLQGKSRISKVGRSDFRAALYAPAMVAYSRRLYPDFVGRLKSRKKPSQLIVVALMRRLVALSFVLWQRQEMYDNAKAFKVA